MKEYIPKMKGKLNFCWQV